MRPSAPPRRAPSAPASVAARIAAAACGGPGILQQSDRRNAALHFQIALRIEDDARAVCGEQVDLLARQPDAVREIHARIERALVGEAPDQRTAMLGQGLPRLQRHAARLIDVRVDRNVVAARQLDGAPHERRRAALRRRWPECPRDARPRRRLEAGRLEVSDEIELALGLRRGRQQRVKLLRKDVFPERNGLDPLPVGVLQGEDDADADLVVGGHHRFHVALVERIERQHVLDRRHSGAQAFERAEERARINLFRRPRRILRRQRIEPPCLERHLLERAFG